MRQIEVIEVRPGRQGNQAGEFAICTEKTSMYFDRSEMLYARNDVHTMLHPPHIQRVSRGSPSM